ncbi:pyrimidine monooxygenase RutA [bacterium BMS3Abin02]|nr:pyrimidine monooxygenase RutA [bacterium BMS3Abin02]GBE23308.1 pyrimidine monooxygenase RutA [bacterium BMS3Bbin01]
MTEPQIGGTYEQLLAAALWAEQAGMVSFARSDHYYSTQDPRPDATDAFATLAGLARETRCIRLAVLVSPITFRHPAVIAKNAATIDQMSGGRFDLGIGTGWMELEHDAFGFPFPPWAERFERLEEALAYLEAAFGPGTGTLSGRYYELDAEVLPKPTDLRIIVGGSGANRTPTLAGTHADEYNHFIASPGEIAPKIARVREAATAAGRDPEAIAISVMGPVLTGKDEASYRHRLENVATARDRDPEDLEQSWSDYGIPVGPPARVREALAALTEIGVSKFYVQHLDLTDLSGLDETLEALAG